MQVLDRYIFFQFLKNFLGALILLVGIALISKVMESLSSATGYDGPFSDVFWFYFFNLPNFFSIVIAPALMFSVSFTIAMFNKTNELAVIMAAGRSFQRIVLYIFIFSAGLSVFLFVFNEAITFRSNFKAYYYYHIITGRGKVFKQQDRKNFEARSGARYFYMGRLSPREGEFENLHVVILNKNGSIANIVDAVSGQINVGKWRLDQATILFFNKQGEFVKREEHKKKVVDFPEGRKFFFNRIRSFEEMNIADILEMMKSAAIKGEPTLPYEVEFHWHFAFPWVCTFVVLIGSMIGSHLKKGAIASAIALSTISTLVYFLIMFFGKSLGNKGVLSPVVAGWLANFVFTIITAFVMLRFRR